MTVTKPIWLVLLSDCKSHVPVEEPTTFHHVYKGRMYQTASNAINACKLRDKVDVRFVTVSAVYGLLWGDMKIENYQKRISVVMAQKLRPKVCQDFVTMWEELVNGEQKVEKIFSSLSAQHRRALPTQWISSVVGSASEIIMAHGGIGTRQGQLKSFLCGTEVAMKIPGVQQAIEGGDQPFVFKGVQYSISTEEAERRILSELADSPIGSLPTTWYCVVGGKQVSCKFAMSCVVGREFALSDFTTQRAVQILRKVGIECHRIDLV